MFEIKNNTPFQADIVVLPDKDGIDHIVAMIKATYFFDTDNKISLAEKQAPICMSDEYFGEPGLSSIKYGSDIALCKRGTDILMVGHAYAYNNSTTMVDVLLKAGVLKKIIRGYGDRYWEYSMGMISKTKPQPFRKMPIVYERAFGGEDKTHTKKEKHAVEERNPIGTGFRINRSKESIDGLPLPNIEDPLNEINSWKDKPKPAGFGFISPSWQPRLSYAGTYDEEWEKEKMPFLPDDFDIKYFNSAHPDLISPEYLNGDEEVEMNNLHPEKRGIKFKLPGVGVDVSFNIKDEIINTSAELDTIVFEPDKNCFTLLWRASAECFKKALYVNSVSFEYKKALN